MSTHVTRARRPASATRGHATSLARTQRYRHRPDRAAPAHRAGGALRRRPASSSRHSRADRRRSDAQPTRRDSDSPPPQRHRDQLAALIELRHRRHRTTRRVEHRLALDPCHAAGPLLTRQPRRIRQRRQLDRRHLGRHRPHRGQRHRNGHLPIDVRMNSSSSDCRQPGCPRHPVDETGTSERSHDHRRVTDDAAADQRPDPILGGKTQGPRFCARHRSFGETLTKRLGLIPKSSVRG